MTNTVSPAVTNLVVTLLSPNPGHEGNPDWLQFAGTVISALAWPCSVVVVFCLIRKPLLELLPQLSRLKIKDVELEFRKVLGAVKKTSLTAKEAKGSASDLLRPREYYSRLAEVSKRSAIMEAFMEVEVAASDAYAKLVRPGLKVFVNPRQIADYLRSQQMISDDDYRTITELSNLRNRAAHEIGQFDINDELVQEYVDVALEMASKIRALH